jgi:hypothetical protein
MLCVMLSVTWILVVSVPIDCLLWKIGTDISKTFVKNGKLCTVCRRDLIKKIMKELVK